MPYTEKKLRNFAQNGIYRKKIIIKVKLVYSHILKMKFKKINFYFAIEKRKISRGKNIYENFQIEKKVSFSNLIFRDIHRKVQKKSLFRENL